MTAYYLRPIAGGTVPPAIISVAIVTRKRDVRLGKARQRILECVAWAVQLAAVDESVGKPRLLLHGNDVNEMWKAVATLLERQSMVWLWCKGLRELLILTDWFTRLELGEWTIGGRDHWRVLEEKLGVKKHFRGYLIDSDPPNVVLAQHRTTGHVVQMVDVVNFGITQWEQIRLDSQGMLDGPLPKGEDSLFYVTIAKERARAVGSWAVGWSRLVRENHWGPLRSTAAGQAMAAFRARYMKSPILVHDNEEARALERQAYFAGRCEAYRIGFVDGPVYHLDIQSCYPALTQEAKVPARFKGIGTTTANGIHRLSQNDWLLIADVTIETNQPDYPYRDEGNVVYPVGRFRTQLCWPELEEAFELDRVVRIHKVAWYEGSVVFHDWSKAMLEMRTLSHKGGMSTLQVGCKRLANCVFGAFAKRERRWTRCNCRQSPGPYAVWYGKVCPRCKPPERINFDCDSLQAFGREPCEHITRWRAIGWASEFETAPRDARDTNVAISAYVCSLARQYLRRLLAIAGRGNVLYMDTDSIWTNETGIDNLSQAGCIVNGTPGMLKLVSSHQSVVINGHKSYSAGTRGAHCGVPEGVQIDANGNAEWESFEGMESAIRRGGKPCAIVVRRRRSKVTGYTGGNVLPDGRILPLHIWKDV